MLQNELFSRIFEATKSSEHVSCFVVCGDVWRWNLEQKQAFLEYYLGVDLMAELDQYEQELYHRKMEMIHHIREHEEHRLLHSQRINNSAVHHMNIPDSPDRDDADNGHHTLNVHRPGGPSRDGMVSSNSEQTTDEEMTDDDDVPIAGDDKANGLPSTKQYDAITSHSDFINTPRSPLTNSMPPDEAKELSPEMTPEQIPSSHTGTGRGNEGLSVCPITV